MYQSYNNNAIPHQPQKRPAPIERISNAIVSRETEDKNSQEAGCSVSVTELKTISWRDFADLSWLETHVISLLI